MPAKRKDAMTGKEDDIALSIERARLYLKQAKKHRKFYLSHLEDKFAYIEDCFDCLIDAKYLIWKNK